MRFGRVDRLFGSLRFRLTFWNTGAILLLVLGILVGLREGLRYTLQREMDELLEEDLQEVRMTLRRFYPDWKRIKEELDSRAISHKARSWFVRIYSADGKELLATAGAPAALQAPEDNQGGPFYASHFRLVQVRLSNSTFPDVLVRLGCSRDFVDADVANLTRMLVVAGLVLLVLAPLSGYWLAGRATRPLATILRTTARLRPGHLEERLPLRGSEDELDRLAGTINGLLDRLAVYLQRQREFVANAAHELRSPLAALRTSAEVALSHDRSPEAYRDLLADMIESCDNLGHLVNQLLLLAEGEAGLEAGAPVRLDQLAARSLEMFSGVAEQRELALGAPVLEPVTVRGQETHLRQVVNNLLDNALKFTPAGGRIDVEVASTPDGQARLRVRDTGVGIGAGDLPHIFERFYRADKARQRGARGGNGLGLSICRALVGAHGGRIHVDSQPGRGTTVTVLLPVGGGGNLASL
jgi:heavy metal sensor kinase